MSRIIGFEGKACWVICEGVPVLTSVDKLRPASGPELLAFLVLNNHDFGLPPRVVENEQQGFLDERDEPPQEPARRHQEGEEPRIFDEEIS